MDLTLKSKKDIDTNKVINSVKERYGLIDLIRGITLISMMLFHMCWDLQYMFGVDMPWYTGKLGFIWERSICVPFIFISGFCIHFGKNKSRKIKRGILISLGGLVVTFVSVLFLDDSPIYFGILTFIGFAMILFALMEDFFLKLKPSVMIAICAVLGLLTSKISYGYIGVNGLFEIAVPDKLYANMLTAFVGLPQPTFYSSDYFAVLPWIFLYGAGYYTCVIFKKYNTIRYLKRPANNPINFIGRHTLPIYMIHQPLIYVILLVIFR